jgi:predicted dehydrogenase
MDRRKFLASSLTAPAFLRGQGTRKYRTALIGSGWWGMNILETALESGQCTPVAMCDVDAPALDKAAERVRQLSGEQPKKYKDYRELLQAEKPEIVIVATPDHWHALPAIAAVKAGAHVYVEKPVGHTVMEGAAMLKAARDAGRMVQVGLHRRVSPHNITGREFLRSGKAGKIGMVRAFVHGGGRAGQPTPPSDPPPGLDWDFWCGPAPLRPYNKSMHPRGFRQYLDFANGTLADWGVHWFDQILWWTEEKYPRKVFSTAARRIRRDSTDAPDTQVVSYEFESFTAVWENRQYAANNAEKHPLGVYFYGEEGTFHMGWRDGWTFYPASKGQPVLHEEPTLHTSDSHNIRELWADFLGAIRENRRPVCDIENGHRSTNMSLLGMISWKVGRSLQWDGARERIAGDAEANKLLRRAYRAPWRYPEA